MYTAVRKKTKESTAQNEEEPPPIPPQGVEELYTAVNKKTQPTTETLEELLYFTAEASMLNKRQPPILAKKSCVGLIALELAPTVNYWFKILD